MRTMTKKSGVIAALTAALVVMTVLVISNCRIPDTGLGSVIGKGPGTDIDIGTGIDTETGIGTETETAKKTGSIRLNFAGKTGARTVTPEVLTLASFESFLLIFTPESGSDIEVQVGVGGDIEDFDEEIVLSVGKYGLEVIAYREDDWTKATAKADTDTFGGISLDSLGGPDDTEIEIFDDDDTEIFVTLRPYGVTGTEDGTFEWDIDNHITGNFSGTLTISTWPTATTTGNGATQTINISQVATTRAGELDIYPGYYFVDLKLTQGDGTFGFREIAWIYQNMTSKFTYDLLNDLVIVPGKGNGIIEIDYEQDGAPTITFSVAISGGTTNAIFGTGSQTDPIIISRTNTVRPNQITITVTSTGVTYNWYFVDDEIGDADEALVITAAANLFGNPTLNGTYPITLIGVNNGRPFTTAGKAIYVQIIN